MVNSRNDFLLPRIYIFAERVVMFWLRKKWKPSRDGRRYVACDLELWPIKNSFCAFLARVKTYTLTKN